ncbi:head-to-tail adaptor [Streptomyces phage Cumberbatch]|uniref:Head-to-tail adaptor n=4 Tax=Ignaciovirus TaxID=3152509 RepID=A0A7D5JJF3_9CAUD|nr:head-to-tail adaptor [Streptomyces phage Eklok]YP_010756246.1 head-to-tail adaptor [Streptomyces phage AxeJC]YP_010756420.1 head-to-tail adaptor [Streptomyces phage Cumberbatch]YP_010756479.1 head-to-tail adaptor [Streptomyces phage Piccadilly]YP_010756537.1 head-to-tail adaptor [Streptomyces phage Eastland]QKN87652.1 head-to-tail adaptor [Streptomyces phage Cumberbatch]QLF83196.1 head-to-tail adaptor [Streptomyces phage Eklok]UJQ86022.1 head-to-tail adaptor [Streptomyces phage Piccadilly
MPRVYATPDQLAEYTGQPAPADASRLLARASEDVEDALTTAIYDTDNAGMPTDPDVISAMADATCAQVEYVTAQGGDDTGAAGQWDSVSIGPVSMSGRRGGPVGAAVDIGPRALRTLARAGLLPGVIW